MPARPTHTILVGNEKLSSGGNVVCLASVFFANWSCQIPSQANVEDDRGRDAPIIFDKGTVDFPAAPGDRALIRLVMNGETRDPEQEIGLRITRDVRTAGRPVKLPARRH